MERGKSLIWGLVLVIVGIILGGNALDLFHVDVFFDGWWTLFIIVPSLFGIASEKDKTASCNQTFPIILFIKTFNSP